MSHRLSAELEYRRSCQKYLEDLVACRDFHTACQYFESIRSIWSGKSDLESGIIMRLGAKAYGSSENLSKALTLIRMAIGILSKTVGETDHSAECYIILGDILREMGKFRGAEKAYRDAESIYRRNDDFSGAGDAFNRLAGILFRKGEFDASLKCLLEAIEYARKENDNKKLAYLFGNIGRVYAMLGRLNDAEENIRFNIELSSEFDDEVELARAYLFWGYVNIQQAKYSKAEDRLTTAIEYIRRNNMEKEEIIHLTYMGELMLKTGQLSEADRLLGEAALRGKKVAPESLLAARPLRHLAELLIKQDCIRKALRTANKAMVLMKKLDDSVEIGALLRIQAVCFNRLGQHEKAREAINNSIAILDERRAEFELADTLAYAGISNLYSPSQSTMYLCRAEEMYNFCGISVKAMEIQKIITNLEANITTTSASRVEKDFSGGDFPTKNARMKEIISHLRLLKGSDLPILFTGETGTGKDFLARYFHSISRPDGPFIAVNCAAVPETLIESELFGYQKGAFTGAETNRQGLFLSANYGVILLNEIGELPPALQAKLLSVLETKKLRPLGTSTEIDLDVIAIAATNRDLSDMVTSGLFRQDLYYRLAGITFQLPPLRERKEDIPHLLQNFMRKFGLLNGDKAESELVRLFVSYHWPGNIRQLENKVKLLSVMASMAKEGSIVELSRSFFEHKKDECTSSLFERVEQFERQLLIEALVSSQGNKSEAARSLSIHESTFRAKMKRYCLEAIAE